LYHIALIIQHCLQVVATSGSPPYRVTTSQVKRAKIMRPDTPARPVAQRQLDEDIVIEANAGGVQTSMRNEHNRRNNDNDIVVQYIEEYLTEVPPLVGRDEDAPEVFTILRTQEVRDS
jgi:hypothetical protein